jgi:hypothetical protein
MKKIILLSLSGMVVFFLTWVGVFSYLYRNHNVYGFASVVKPLSYDVRSDNEKLTLDFTPNENGLGILELDLSRENTTNKGMFLIQLKDKERDITLSSNTYTTTHMDSSKPLLVSFSGKKNLKTGAYQLVIQTKPRSLLLEYLVKSGLKTRGVYFVDRTVSITNSEQLLRLVGWKMYEVTNIFGMQLIYIFIIVPLLLPFLIYLLYWQYKQRRIYDKIAELTFQLFKHILYQTTLLLKTRIEHDVRDTRTLITHYWDLIRYVVMSLYRLWKSWYTTNHKFFWDCVLVCMWIMANLVFSFTDIKLTDTHYLWYIGAYILSYLFHTFS